MTTTNRLCRSLKETGLCLGFLLIIAVTVSCQTSITAEMPDQEDTRRKASRIVEILPEVQAPPAELLDESPLRVDEITPPKGHETEEAIRLPERDVPLTRHAPDKQGYPENLIKDIRNPDDLIEAQFNFDAAPLAEVIPLFAKLLHFSFQLDPEVQGAVTMTVDSQMSARQIWQLFEHVLWMSGAYASRNPGFLHVLPFSKMPREHRILANEGDAANVQVDLIRMNYAAADQMAVHIAPFMTVGASVQVIPSLNSLLIVDDPDNMPKIQALIEKLDGRGEAAWPHVSLRCSSVDAQIIRDELAALLPVLGLSVTDKMPSKGEVKVVALPRLQAIIAAAPVPEVLEEIKRWVRVLDRHDAAEQENLYFYNVRHSTADHLAEALQIFFTQSTKQARQTTSQSAAISRRAETDPREIVSPRPRQNPNNGSAANSASSENVFDTPIVVYADGEQNRLTVRTTQRAYTMVEALLKRLDVPTRQVAIQAYIAEITLTKRTEFGLAYAAVQNIGDYTLKHGAGHARDAFSTPRNIITAEPAGRGLTLLLEHVQDEDKLAFIRAIAGEGNVRVLSAPQIVAASGEEAEIQVGDEVPIITSDISSTAGVIDGNSLAVRRQIQYRQTGVLLTVTPHITAGNEVRMQVRQEVSSASIPSGTSGVLLESPTISKKNLHSVLVVPDGGTVLMGGLIETRDEDSHSGIPWLKDIPVLGRLFRTNMKAEDRRELVVLMSVRVIQNQSVTESLLERYDLAVDEIRKRMER